MRHSGSVGRLHRLLSEGVVCETVFADGGREHISTYMTEQWIPADVAKRIAFSRGQERPIEFIVEMASIGSIGGKAMIARGAKNYNNFLAWDWEVREWPIPQWFWDSYSSLTDGERDWKLGRLSGICQSPDGLTWLELRGVRFSGEELGACLQSYQAPTQDNSPSETGRRPKYDWPSAVLAVFGQIFRGDLKPENQADVEAALRIHFALSDLEPGESTLRPYAKLVWEEARRV